MINQVGENYKKSHRFNEINEYYRFKDLDSSPKIRNFATHPNLLSRDMDGINGQ